MPNEIKKEKFKTPTKNTQSKSKNKKSLPKNLNDKKNKKNQNAKKSKENKNQSSDKKDINSLTKLNNFKSSGAMFFQKIIESPRSFSKIMKKENLNEKKSTNTTFQKIGKNNSSKKANKKNEIKTPRNKKIEKKLSNTEPMKKMNKRRSQSTIRSNKTSKMKKEFDYETIFNNIKNENQKNYQNKNKNDHKDQEYKKKMLFLKKENIKLKENVNFLQESNSLLLKDKEKVVEYYMKKENLGLLDPKKKSKYTKTEQNEFKKLKNAYEEQMVKNINLENNMKTLGDEINRLTTNLEELKREKRIHEKRKKRSNN
ncbi:hypothetical protein M0813_10680 [Anaeramoeba flamelloides]|uniref:Uncharacterized protein n=1 Tax=Anaeramoeba flamelloides TaxID=1746091 RepID=A0ABQ8X1X6_9EUKA|nr:hypothetical protein M0813_10680 [Anaeramoeba flamelloides]